VLQQHNRKNEAQQRVSGQQRVQLQREVDELKASLG
jgi:hypothetical protein